MLFGQENDVYFKVSLLMTIGLSAEKRDGMDPSQCVRMSRFGPFCVRAQASFRFNASRHALHYRAYGAH